MFTVNRLFVAASSIKAAPRLQRNLQTTFLEVLVHDLSIIKAASRLEQQNPTPKVSWQPLLVYGQFVLRHVTGIDHVTIWDISFYNYNV